MSNNKTTLPTIIVAFSLMLLGTECLAQSKQGVKSVEVTVEKYNKNGTVATKHIDSSEKYDAKGRTIEECEYDEDGKLLKRKTYTYDAAGNKIGAIIYKPNGEVDDKVEYKYENGLRVEKLTYGAKGRLKSRKTYKYTR